MFYKFINNDNNNKLYVILIYIFLHCGSLIYSGEKKEDFISGIMKTISIIFITNLE